MALVGCHTTYRHGTRDGVPTLPCGYVVPASPQRTWPRGDGALRVKRPLRSLDTSVAVAATVSVRKGPRPGLTKKRADDGPPLARARLARARRALVLPPAEGVPRRARPARPAAHGRRPPRACPDEARTR